MDTFLKATGKKWLESAARNPKKFYLYSMLFLSVSFAGALIQGIFYPSESVFMIKPPALYTKSTAATSQSASGEKEMQKIVEELKELKIKRDKHSLAKDDSLRIEYLYNHYQKLKNGL